MSLTAILEKFSEVQVLVIGDLMLDKYIWGDVSRISPEAPVQVVNVQKKSYSPGGAANTAANIGSLGGRSVLIGVAGNDVAKQQLTELLSHYRTDTRHVIVDIEKPTTQKVRVIAHNQQLLRFDYEDAKYISEEDENKALQAIRDTIDSVQAIVVSDYAKGLITQSLITAITKEAKLRSLPLLVDPKPGQNIRYKETTLITPNSMEILKLAGMASDGDVVAAGKALAKNSQSNVLITRGEHGMSLIRKDGIATHFPTLAREVYDVTGAGDTVIAALALSIAAGASLEDAATIANYAAGITVGKVGTATVSRTELMDAIAE